MSFFDYEAEYPWLAERPATVAQVTFPHQPLTTPLRWPALLDTGSPYIILPGKCAKNGLFCQGERVEVILHVFDRMRNKQDIPIALPIRGTPEPIRGFNGSTNWYLPFCAHLFVPGFVEDYYTVYFEEMDYMIVGSPILLKKGGVCFRRDVYRSGRCWRRPFV